MCCGSKVFTLRVTCDEESDLDDDEMINAIEKAGLVLSKTEPPTSGRFSFYVFRCNMEVSAAVENESDSDEAQFTSDDEDSEDEDNDEDGSDDPDYSADQDDEEERKSGNKRSGTVVTLFTHNTTQYIQP